jgi:hypothetical protein
MQLLGYLLIAVVVAAILFYCVVALMPDGPPFQATRDERPFDLPGDGRMVGEDLESLRIPVSLRGYRFAETDALIDRLGAEIVARDQEIARLRATGNVSAEQQYVSAEQLVEGRHATASRNPTEPTGTAGEAAYDADPTEPVRDV